MLSESVMKAGISNIQYTNHMKNFFLSSMRSQLPCIHVFWWCFCFACIKIVGVVCCTDWRLLRWQTKDTKKETLLLNKMFCLSNKRISVFDKVGIRWVCTSCLSDLLCGSMLEGTIWQLVLLNERVWCLV